MMNTFAYLCFFVFVLILREWALPHKPPKDFALWTPDALRRGWVYRKAEPFLRTNEKGLCKNLKQSCVNIVGLISL